MMVLTVKDNNKNINNSNVVKANLLLNEARILYDKNINLVNERTNLLINYTKGKIKHKEYVKKDDQYKKEINDVNKKFYQKIKEINKLKIK